jgi:hypothetical protein
MPTSYPKGGKPCWSNNCPKVNKIASIEEAIKKPLHKIKRKDTRGAKSSKGSVLKDK